MDTVWEESYGVIPLRHVEGHWQVLLILHKYGNHWGFPKGKPEENEDARTSAYRELEEETGLHVEKPLVSEPFSEKYAFIRGGKNVQKRVTYYPAIVSGALLLQPEEILDGLWLNFDEALKRLTFIEAKNLCKKIQEMLNE